MHILQTKEVYLEQSGYQAALLLERQFSAARAGLFSLMLGALTILGGLLTLLFLEKKFLGATEIFFGLFLGFLTYSTFLNFLKAPHELSYDEISKAWEHRAFGKILSFSAAKLIEAGSRGENLLLPAFWEYLLQEPTFLWILRRLNIPQKQLFQKVKEAYAPAAALPLAEILQLAWQKALGANHLEVEEADILVAIFEFEIKEQDLLEVASWQRRRALSGKLQAKFWSLEHLLNTKGIGKDWAGGYTINLDRVAYDLTERAKYASPPAHLYGHRQMLELLERLLLRGGGAGNVVLVGAPGVGRHTLLRAFASKLNRGQTFGPLRYKRLLQIDSSAVISGTALPNEVVEKIQILFSEATFAQNVILVLSDIDAFFDPHPEAGRVNATEALLPFLQSSLHAIGITTPQGYQNTIGKNPQLARLFSKLEISEASEAQTLLILQDEAPGLERQTGLFFTHLALKEMVKLATKLIQNLPNPEKSLEILQETATFVATKLGEEVVTLEHVQKVITTRTKVPVEKVAAEERDILLNLESILHERIIGQEEAIRELADALRRARSGVASEKRPIGSFLFLGPTGVGKTETTKALAAVYFGSEQRIIRFDMSEFQEIHSINRLIGDADTASGGLLTEAVIANPFSLILLDELEKAHPKVLDLFLQVFDDGRLTDALGRTVSFVNTMIVATSNAGAESIREMVRAGRNPQQVPQELLNELQSQGIFRPEFLNRFDAVIIFRPLSAAELTQVAVLLLRELNERLQEKDIQIKVTPELAQAVVAGGFSPEFGARPLRRFIQEHIENYVANGMIKGEIQRGQVVEIPSTVL